MNYFNDLNPYLVREEDFNERQKRVDTSPSTALYTENILRNNIGKTGTFYFTYTGSTDWRDQVYTGVLEQAGRDHFVIFDKVNNKRYLLASVYYAWAEFEEPLNYGP